MLNLLSGLYHQFILNFNMKNTEKILMELHGMLKTINANMIKPRSINSTTHVMAISEDGVKRNKTFHPKGKVKGKVG